MTGPIEMAATAIASTYVSGLLQCSGCRRRGSTDVAANSVHPSGPRVIDVTTQYEALEQQGGDERDREQDDGDRVAVAPLTFVEAVVDHVGRHAVGRAERADGRRRGHPDHVEDLE